MEVTKVKEAARLLEKYEKLGQFLAGAPEGAETLTLTLRKGTKSKSATIAYSKADFDAEAFVEDMRRDCLEKMRELGVDL